MHFHYFNDFDLVLLHFQVFILFILLFHSKGGPYAAFGGRDASRGLATFNVTSSDTEEYDDLSDLDTMEMESVREWEMQFKGMSMLIFTWIFNSPLI